MRIEKALVTGGAGFIGSHVIDRLREMDVEVVVFDNLSTGSVANLKEHEDAVNLIEGDILDLDALASAMSGCDSVFHLAANADVRGGIETRRVDLEQNTVGTWNVCEAMNLTGAKQIAFSSSATVYGEPSVFPTPETYKGKQTSLYGASKLSGEALIEAYSEYFGITGLIFRFVSWIGPRYSHGVIYDFFMKLRADPSKLAVLGDGSQRKSYLSVEDGVDGVFMALETAERGKAEIFNVGHHDYLDVNRMAEVVCDEMGVGKVPLEYSGGHRGWIGDSPLVMLDTGKLRERGWAPTMSIEESVRSTVRDLARREAS